MESYFAIKKINKNLLILSEEDRNHIKNVMRHNVGDSLLVIFDGQKYNCFIKELDKSLICEINNIIITNNELPIEITLIMALLKAQKFDLVIQKAIELGASKIVPIQLERCVSVINDNQSNKINRWQKIARAAAMQANRNVIPEIMPIVKNIEDIKLYKSEVNYVAYENTKKQFDWALNLAKAKSVTVIVGPEGGISNREINLFLQDNFQAIALGPTILRAETAPLYLLAVINYICSNN